MCGRNDQWGLFLKKWSWFLVGCNVKSCWILSAVMCSLVFLSNLWSRAFIWSYALSLHRSGILQTWLYYTPSFDCHFNLYFSKVENLEKRFWCVAVSTSSSLLMLKQSSKSQGGAELGSTICKALGWNPAASALWICNSWLGFGFSQVSCSQWP